MGNRHRGIGLEQQPGHRPPHHCTAANHHRPLAAPYGALAADAAALLHRRLPAAASRAQLAAAVAALLRCGYLPHAPLYRGAARLALGGGGGGGGSAGGDRHSPPPAAPQSAAAAAALLGSAPLSAADALQLLEGVLAAEAAERGRAAAGSTGGSPPDGDLAQLLLRATGPPGGERGTTPERARAEVLMTRRSLG